MTVFIVLSDVAEGMEIPPTIFFQVAATTAVGAIRTAAIYELSEGDPEATEWINRELFETCDEKDPLHAGGFAQGRHFQAYPLSEIQVIAEVT